MALASFNRTLDQELLALMRGVSLECLVCGEFVLRRPGSVTCPECGSSLGVEEVKSGLHLNAQAG
jgi:Zn finger protein HypA/HybF involved in hydrogenase expression